MRFRRKVQSGEKLGRKLGFPTLNFKIGNFGDYYEPGVYACVVGMRPPPAPPKEGGKNKLLAPNSQLPAFRGALYYGPKGGGKNVLEIHVLNFSEQIYGQFVSFEVEEKIRGPKKFESLEALKEGIGRDVAQIKELKVKN